MLKLLGTLLLLVGSMACAWPADTLEPVRVDQQDQYTPLGPHLRYLEDRSGNLSARQLRLAGNYLPWREHRAVNPSFGYSSSAYWFTFDIENSASEAQARLLEVAYPILDSVTLYTLRNGNLSTGIETGDLKPFAQRPMRHRNFVFPLAVNPHERLTVYLRIRSSSAVQVPLTLWSERAFWLHEQTALLSQGIYIGIILVMMLYNLFIYSAVRDRSYLYYVLFVGLFLIVQLGLRGFAFQYFWPDSPWLASKAVLTPVSTALVFGALFTSELLALRSNHPHIYRLFIFIASLCALTAVTSLFAPYAPAMIVSLALTFCLCSCSLGAGIVMWRSNYAPARYYTIAWTALLIGALSYVLNKVGVIPRNIVTENAMQVGSALEVVLLSFALASRINSIRREKDIAQAQTVAVLAKYQALYENAVEGIFQLNLQRKLVNANRAMAKILGFPHAIALLKHQLDCVDQFFSEATDAERFAAQLTNKGLINRFEVCAKRSNGTEFWASWSVHTVYDEQGQPLHYEGSVVDITERRRAEEQIRYLAYFDKLTGLPNRVLLQEQLRHTLERAKRNGQLVAVLWFDLDRFKPVNDMLGHAAGDELLRKVAMRLTEGLRGADAIARVDLTPLDVEGNLRSDETVARLGGDEFVMVLGDIRRPQDAALVARRVNDALSRPFNIKGQALHVAASIGIATYPLDGETAEMLLRNADIAMYYAKKRGGIYQFHSQEIDSQVAIRLELESELRLALSEEQFSLHFQSRVELGNKRITSFEALCRWHHPRRGQISPTEFIPIAEESGFIGSLGDWVLYRACAQSHAWQAKGIAAGHVSINLSARQFRAEHFTEKLRDILLATKADPSWLEFELTESVLMDDINVTRHILHKLKDLGVSIAVDDFGTGYSSLSYLKHFPVDVLKIDRAFIKDIVDDHDNQAITAAIISMAQRLKLKVAAEGIETAEQFEYLRCCGCDEGQGYYIGVPLPATEIRLHLDDLSTATIHAVDNPVLLN